MSEFDQLPVITDPEESRCPCLLLLDVSGSMSGQKIAELNRGLKQFAVELSNDSLASKRVEIGIVTFGPVRVQTEFISARDFRPPDLDVQGGTPMGEAVLRATEMVERRKNEYKKNGITYYRPWIFLITDGEPTDYGETNWLRAVDVTHSGERDKSFAFFSVGVSGANFSHLNELCTRQPLQLKGLKFRELFTWLSSSLSSVSRSVPGDEVPLENPSGWGTAPT